MQEKAFIGQVLDAITKPSSEHLSTYLGLGLALAIVAGVVLIALGGSKKESQIKFSLEDSLNEDKQKEEAARKQPKKAPKAKEDEDWSDEGGLDVDELHKDLDQKGPFMRTD